jgi:hypothetical protein
MIMTSAEGKLFPQTDDWNRAWLDLHLTEQ